MVVIPTYCEREALPEVLDQVLTLANGSGAIRVCVVDDSSPDGTADLVRRLQERHAALELLEQPRAAGRGPAVLAAMRMLLRAGNGSLPELLIEMDGDGSHCPAAIPALMALATNGADVALGSRYVAGGGADLSRGRKTLSAMTNAFARTVLRLPYADCSTGYRCYRVATLARLDLSELTSSGHATHIELLYRLHRIGARISEAPIHYRERRGGRSKVDSGRIAQALGQLLALRLRTLATPAGALRR